MIEEILGIFLLYFHLFLVSFSRKVLEKSLNIGKALKNIVSKCSRGHRQQTQRLFMSKHWKGFKTLCFEIFRGPQAVNIKIVMEHLANSEETLSIYSKSDNPNKLSITIVTGPDFQVFIKSM